MSNVTSVLKRGARNFVLFLFVLILTDNFDAQAQGSSETIRIWNGAQDAHLLNPRMVVSAALGGKTVAAEKLHIQPNAVQDAVTKTTFRKGKGDQLQAAFTIQVNTADARFLLLLEQKNGKTGGAFPQVKIWQNKKELKAQVEKHDGRWTWYAVDVPTGQIDLQIHLKSQHNSWQGRASGWVIAKYLPGGETLILKTKKKIAQRAIPPKPCPSGAFSRTFKLGEIEW
jgi:hypothetical protein